MKKLFTFSIALLASRVIMAQAVCSTVPPLAEPKFDPKPDSVECLVKGQPYEQAFKFRVPDAAGAFTIEWLAIDSVTNLPTGLTYELNKGVGAQYNANETGCVLLSGTPTSPAGQYRLGIYVRLKVASLGTPLAGELYSLAASQGEDGGKYVIFIRLKDAPGPQCPCLDTTKVTPAEMFVAYDGSETMCDEIHTSISEVQETISQLTIMPNPVTNVATVKFISDKTATYTAKVTNLIGKVVMSKSVDIRTGNNAVTFDRSKLPSGIYFFSLTDGKGLTTKRFAIQ